MAAKSCDIQPYLDQLRRLPFVDDARLRSPPRQASAAGFDATVVIRTPTGKERMRVELLRSHLARETAARVLQLARAEPRLLVLAPAVGRDLGELLASSGVNFVDLAGNCHLRIDDKYVARMQGMRAAPRPITDKGLRAPAYRVLLALLGRPSLAEASGRALAEAAGGVSPQTALDLRARLLERGILLRGGGSNRWAPDGYKAAVDLFVAGASSTLMPSLSVGRFRAPDGTVSSVEAKLARGLNGRTRWRWGGGAACQRLTGHFRGDRTVVYVEQWDARLVNDLRLVTDAAGPILVATLPGPVALESPHPETVHPVLVYADLSLEGDERAREAAGDVYAEYLLGPNGDGR
jgi:hypothetical protein